ncbi:O-fucosyltransferase 8 isoform X2 [Diospyros lotus]|uniref:O-fucosyltransferase 8 isoform X2 n=1 Tax=Diospyros lotus TaxID=55363 RepID=UPI0022529DAE|nr:O-fucosyltransferase 8 isoform X2 [Diospyros lotus]
MGNKALLLHGLKNETPKFSASKSLNVGKRHLWSRKYIPSVALTFGFTALLLLLDSLVFSAFDPINTSIWSKDERAANVSGGQIPVQMYDRLLNLASSALSKKEHEQDLSKFWEEQFHQTVTWRPCADRKTSRNLGKPKNSTGYILVSANGGLNQQRVAVCNAVAVASLLNATLVIPKFLYSNVWKDPSQFADIYQEKYFFNMLKDEVNLVKELPSHLKSLDFEEIGSLKFPRKQLLGIILKLCFLFCLRMELFISSDLEIDLASIHCPLNFRRIRKYSIARNVLDRQLLGNFLSNIPSNSRPLDAAKGPSRYLALHLRFEIDMVAYSRCEFGGGEDERKELQSYRESHFPLLIQRLKNSKPVSATELRMLGRCPLTPEEAALVLAGLGFKHGTFIYLAGSHIYGGKARMQALTSLYPNLVTKEDLLTASELAPFRNYSSRLAALDFIACATADVFAITDSGSQLSSLVSGLRTYYGGGHAPTLRPSKKRLAAILSENDTLTWESFEERIRKMIEEGQRPRTRGYGRNIYRQPRCLECMCKYRS